MRNLKSLKDIQKAFDVDPDEMKTIRALISKKLSPVAHEESFYGEKYDLDGYCQCSDDDTDDYPTLDCCIYSSMFPFDGSWAEQVLYHLNLLTDNCLISEIETRSGLTALYLKRDNYNLPTIAAIGMELYWVADMFELEKM